MRQWLSRATIALVVIGLLVLAGRHLFGLWQHAREVERILLVLRPVLADPEIAQLEEDWAFSQHDGRFSVQVSPPQDPGRSHLTTWSAYEIDRRADEPQLAANARGVVIEWDEDGTLSLDPLNHAIPIERLARTADEIAWIAFCRRSLHSIYAVGANELRSERVDLRVVRRDDPGLIGRLTAEGIPPRRIEQSDLNRSHAPSASRIGQDLVVLLDDPHTAVEEEAPPFPTECFADGLPPLGSDQPEHASCADGATDACLSHCRAGEAGSCLAAAYGLDNGWWHRPDELYRLACVGGSASGCTNYGATWLALAAPDDALATSCSLALFERACAAHDSYACGMVGPALLRSGADTAAIRARLESACGTIGYFACEELAWMLEQGHLGPVGEGDVQHARERACDTGYAPSCTALPEPRAAPPPSTPIPPSASQTIVRRAAPSL